MQQLDHQRISKSFWWWAYFALSVVVLVASIVTGLQWPLRTFLLTMIDGIGVLGLWGYLRIVPIGRRMFWVGYFSLVAVFGVYSAGSILLRAAHSDALFLISLLLASAIVSAPAWLAIWRYAFRSAHIWNSQS